MRRVWSFPALFDELGHQARPPRLVGGPDAPPLVAVEVLVEQDKVAPVRVLLEAVRVAVDGPAAVAPAQEQAGEPAGQLGGDLPEVQQPAGAGRTLDLQVVPVEV